MSNDKLAGMAAEAEATCFDEWDRGYAAGLRAELAEIERHEAEKQAGPVAEPVGEAVSMPGTSGFTMACFKSADVPIGTKLYTAPPSPLTEQDKDDAERWRELRRQHESDDAYALTLFGPDDDEGLSPIGSMPGELDEAIDTARAARAKKE